MSISLKVQDKNGFTLAVARSEREVNLPYCAEYMEGDQIVVEASDTPAFYWLSLDDGRGHSLVYLTGDMWYKIPFGDRKSVV